jgi:hypothetical protein
MILSDFHNISKIHGSAHIIGTELEYKRLIVVEVHEASRYKLRKLLNIFWQIPSNIQHPHTFIDRLSEEFEVIAIKINLAMRREYRALKNEVRDFIIRAKRNANRVSPGAEHTVNYNYNSKVLDIDIRRVQVNNTRFGFSEPNPSDMAEA